MCTYCMVGDDFFRRSPPWNPYDPQVPWWNQPTIPQPAPNIFINPWPVEQVKEFLELLERVKKLEDKIGCPCEPNKADYIDLLKRRVAALEAEVAKKQQSGSPDPLSSS